MKVELIQNDTTLRVVHHKGISYAVVHEKGEYQIKLTNHTFQRRLAVVSVDGVNILNGEDASYSGPGYVLNAWETVVIPGWRRSDGTVAAFNFDTKDNSYVAQTDRGTGNAGVIGVAWFNEHVVPYTPLKIPVVPVTPYIPIVNPWIGPHNPWGPYYPATPWAGTICRGGMSTSTTTSSKSVNATVEPVFGEALQESYGTGYGEEKTFYTQSTTFVRETTTPNSTTTLRYASVSDLKAWGVPLEVPVKPQEPPNPFPKEKVMRVPEPKNWMYPRDVKAPE